MTMPSKNDQGSDSVRRKTKAAKLEDHTNDKWLELSKSAKMNEVLRVSASFFEEHTSTKQELDLQDLNEDDIRELQEKDAFLYYSIPGVRAAKVALKDIDYSDVNALCQGVSQVSLAPKLSSKRRHRQVDSTKVVRRSCVSFEAHTSLLLEDLLDELSDDDDFSTFECDELDILLGL